MPKYIAIALDVQPVLKTKLFTKFIKSDFVGFASYLLKFFLRILRIKIYSFFYRGLKSEKTTSTEGSYYYEDADYK